MISGSKSSSRRWSRTRSATWRTTSIQSSPARCIVASRSPIPASTTSAMSCSGARTSPTLIDATLRLLGPDGEVIDEVFSYTALRAVGVEGDRFVLNNRALQLRLVLDQGYWPDSGMTAPDGNALRRDVELAKAMGFNGVRKHQKIEDPRYLYWADRLGLLVWEEMPSAYRFTLGSIDRLAREWTAALLRDVSHPCVVTWVPFNESWGVPDLPDASAAAALHPGALPPDQGARSHPPRCRQRRMGERRNRHHRRP